MSTTRGIFVGSPYKPQFYHASFTQIVFKDHYFLTENLFKVIHGVHFFVSSVLNAQYPTFISFELARGTVAQFGLITHSIDQNRTISVRYSTSAGAFTVNGELKARYGHGQELMEIKYDPQKRKVSYASSSRESRIFSCGLEQELSSFFVIMQGGEIRYSCGLNARTTCMKNKLKLKDMAKPKR